MTQLQEKALNQANEMLNGIKPFRLNMDGIFNMLTENTNTRTRAKIAKVLSKMNDDIENHYKCVKETKKWLQAISEG